MNVPLVNGAGQEGVIGHQRPQPGNRSQTVLVIYTDLDGTLLDERTYSFEAARPALNLIRGRPILLIPCTSKTREELWPIMGALGMQHPFIIENGGGFFFPARLLGMAAPNHLDGPDWIRVELGKPYPAVVDFLACQRVKLGFDAIGFHDLSSEEIARLCDLPLDQACRAKNREYDEPFLITDRPDEALPLLQSAAVREGFQITRGGRFHHLSGGSDKGRAVRSLTQLLQWWFGNVFTVGIGDSPNDLPMLKSVDLPIVVRRPDGKHHPDLAGEIPFVRLAEGIGPAGWNGAVIEVLREREKLCNDCRAR